MVNNVYRPTLLSVNEKRYRDRFLAEIISIAGASILGGVGKASSHIFKVGVNRLAILTTYFCAGIVG